MPLTECQEESIDIRDPDDEIVGHGFFHVERMDKDHVWIGFLQGDDYIHLHLHSKKKITMVVMDERA